jgi:hypothetical protein
MVGRSSADPPSIGATQPIPNLVGAGTPAFCTQHVVATASKS